MKKRELAEEKGWKFYDLSEVVYDGLIAFEEAEALKLVNYAKHEVLPILGGDVYYWKDGKLFDRNTYGGWYCDVERDEPLSRWVERSYEISLKYIQLNVQSCVDCKPLFDITIEDDIEEMFFFRELKGLYLEDQYELIRRRCEEKGERLPFAVYEVDGKTGSGTKVNKIINHNLGGNTIRRLVASCSSFLKKYLP